MKQLRLMLEAWAAAVGTPCQRCESMALTRAKFMIADDPDFEQKERQPRLVRQHGNDIDTLGPDGLELGHTQFRLGTLADLNSRQRDCPFCRLAVRSLSEQYQVYETSRMTNGGVEASEAELKKRKAQYQSEFYHDGSITCLASWQIDGRKLRRGPDGEIIDTRACSRRIRLRWILTSDLPPPPLIDRPPRSSYRESRTTAGTQPPTHRMDINSPRATPSSPRVSSFAPQAPKRSETEMRKSFGTLPLDIYVVLMAPRNADRGLFLGRSVGSVKVDASLIKKWVDLCETSHGKLCMSHSQNAPLTKSFFGVIDVEEMCLTSLPPKARYVALSYTWGAPKENDPRTFVTNTSNIRDLLKPGGIRNVRGQIPRTIRDAIDLVGGLGERYLWVDALCIIQDSTRSWDLNAKVMDSVYGNAYLTICAADGDNSHAGLKRLHSPPQKSERQDTGRRHEQNIVQYNQEFSLMTTQPAENYISGSAWNKRGWTFQERLLSRRNLIFAANQVFFQCRCTARSVDIFTEHESVGWSLGFKDSPLLMLRQLSTNPLLVYKKSLELYMVRKLSKEKDILAAFTGLGNLVCDALGGNLVFGLPSSHFDWALLWESRDAAIERTGKDEIQFPSWSWCGWKDQIMEYKSEMLAGCEENLHDWLMNHTWITWYIRDGNGNLRLVWDGQEPQNLVKDSPSAGYRRRPCSDDEAYDPYGRSVPLELRKKRRCKEGDFLSIIDECPYDVNITTDSGIGDLNSTKKDMPYLQFFTWSAYFRVSEHYSTPENIWGASFRRYSIEDYKGDWCGTILLDRHQMEARVRNYLFKPMEFIAISDAKSFSEREHKDWAYYIPAERQESSWDLYFVLLIETPPDQNISRRVGLGKVFKSAFNNTCTPEGKTWKEIILG